MSKTFKLIAGPCVVEDYETCLEIGNEVDKIASHLGIEFYFKASFQKANRSSLNSFIGIGDEKALEIIERVGKEIGRPTLTDVHSPEDCLLAAKYVDVLQIPAFLCRQTALLVAAAQTGKVINIKKGQFMSPESMSHAFEKVKQSGNGQIWLTERGTTFGYNDLVVDITSIPRMQAFGETVFMDCTHAMQKPNLSKGVTGGKPEFIETICLAATAAGADGLFIEVHPNPSKAKSDAATMLGLSKLEGILEKCMAIRNVLG